MYVMFPLTNLACKGLNKYTWTYVTGALCDTLHFLFQIAIYVMQYLAVLLTLQQMLFDSNNKRIGTPLSNHFFNLLCFQRLQHSEHGTDMKLLF